MGPYTAHRLYGDSTGSKRKLLDREVQSEEEPDYNEVCYFRITADVIDLSVNNDLLIFKQHNCFRTMVDTMEFSNNF